MQHRFEGIPHPKLALEFQRILNCAWAGALDNLGISGDTVFCLNTYDAGRRVYFHDDKVYKIELTSYTITTYRRGSSLEREYKILEQCRDICRIPRAINYVGNNEFRAIVLERIEGRRVNEIPLNFLSVSKLIAQLTVLLLQLSLRGIRHNDVIVENILIDERGQCYLIDFDQAKHVGVCRALIGNFIGTGSSDLPIYGSLRRLLRQFAIHALPHRLYAFVKKISGTMGKFDQTKQLPKIPSDASRRLELMHSAWRIAQRSKDTASRSYMAYYSLDFEGYHFPGERDWMPRWEILRNITDTRGKRTLELGCNQALLSCFLLKEGGVTAAMAVDLYLDVLRAAEGTAKAFGVSPALRRKNFDDPSDWETDLIEFKPDIVYALSIFNWVKDKRRFMAFLGNFEEVVFEGHETYDIETQRFREVGFDRARFVGTIHRNRPVIHFQKSSTGERV